MSNALGVEKDIDLLRFAIGNSYFSLVVGFLIICQINILKLDL